MPDEETTHRLVDFLFQGLSHRSIMYKNGGGTLIESGG